MYLALIVLVVLAARAMNVLNLREDAVYVVVYVSVMVLVKVKEIIHIVIITCVHGLLETTRRIFRVTITITTISIVIVKA